MIDTFMDFDDALKAADSLLPKGDYEFIVEKYERRDAAKGGWYWNWYLKVINGEHVGKYFFYMTMPYNADGSVSTFGIANLAKLVQACGLRWTGTSFDETTLLGQTGRLHNEHAPRKEGGQPVLDGDGAPVMQNEVTFPTRR